MYIEIKQDFNNFITGTFNDSQLFDSLIFLLFSILGDFFTFKLFYFFHLLHISGSLRVSHQVFQSGPIPGTFTRLRSCIVPAENTEPLKISGGQNHKYDRLV